MSVSDDLKLSMQDISILCVEDESFSLRFLTETLKRMVKEVHSAQDGQEGLYAYSRFSPDIVITDIEMPRLNGLDMAEAIRESDPESVIVVSTAFDNIDYLKRAITLRLDEFISKPVKPAELKNAIVRGLEKINVKREQKRYQRFTELMLGGMPFPVMLINHSLSRVEIANPAARAVGYDQQSPLKGGFFTDKIKMFMQEIAIPKTIFRTHDQHVTSLQAFDKSWDVYLKPVGSQNVIFAAVDVTWRNHLEKLRDDVERITRHDMKTPLNGVIAIPDLLLESDNLSEEQIELINYIKSSGHTLLNMVNLSLDLYKMEQGKYLLKPERLNVLETINKVLVQLGPLVRGKNITASILFNARPLHQDTVIMAMGEELLCYSMLSNIIKNALEASPHQETITINIEYVLDQVMISIHNKGSVPEEIRASFFDKLSTAGKDSGTGLGTYSAQLMARTMKGHIEMETSIDYGTFLKIFLPKAA
ncbi:ATP-binding response regulator [Desulfonatronovibrio magnus]|uniref:ATP-binding response regulator n=1 Tax=Desulfonatronovibrio magnus TaxID=698827 RepID=UPI000697825B|nr:response regulator [Desulfonatronovibrio magnus]